MLLLACVVICGTAGAAALDASYGSARETYNASNPDGPALDTLDTGRDTGSSLAYLLAFVGFFAVPLGIIGILMSTYSNRGGGVGR